MLESNTIANITHDLGKGGARAVLDKTVISRWLEQYNTDPAAMDEAVERFTGKQTRVLGLARVCARLTTCVFCACSLGRRLVRGHLRPRHRRPPQ